MTYLVSVYIQDRVYGGPEEGGWWYTAGGLVRTLRLFRNQDAAYEYCRRLNEKLASRQTGPNTGRRSISSVLSDGEFVARVDENYAPPKFPEEAPYYC